MIKTIWHRLPAVVHTSNSEGPVAKHVFEKIIITPYRSFIATSLYHNKHHTPGGENGILSTANSASERSKLQ